MNAGRRLPTARWEALGTCVVLRLADAGPEGWDSLPRARALVERELAAIDRACSRFRADSDLSRVNAAAGGPPVPVAPLLIEALELALRAARLTDGDVDPTVGAALVLAGYDRDWSLLERSAAPGAPLAISAAEARPAATTPDAPPATPAPAAPAPVLAARLLRGHTTVRLDAARGTVRVPRGVALDLGASAKAWAADRAARVVHGAEGCGALVSVGGDLATAGDAPAGGWRIHVTDDHRCGPDAPGQTICIVSGGLATSSILVRRWRRLDAEMHHIIDPSLGAPARGPWRTVSVAAADCAGANIAATAALVRGERAPVWLERLGLPARLVAHDGAVLALGAWPADTQAAPWPDTGTDGRIGCVLPIGPPLADAHTAPSPDRRSGAPTPVAASTHVDDPPS
jgi:thiamine biosynthesis lipoprotein ApbE